jgi:hypothetical protein
MLDVFFRDNAEQRLLLVSHRYRHGNRLVQSPEQPYRPENKEYKYLSSVKFEVFHSAHVCPIQAATHYSYRALSP